MADSPISASGCVTETTRKCYSAKSIETASMPPRNAQTCLACFPRAITAVLCISSRTIKPYKSYSQAALQPPTQRASASASRNLLLIISKRDPENSPIFGISLSMRTPLASAHRPKTCHFHLVVRYTCSAHHCRLKWNTMHAQNLHTACALHTSQSQSCTKPGSPNKRVHLFHSISVDVVYAILDCALGVFPSIEAITTPGLLRQPQTISCAQLSSPSTTRDEQTSCSLS